MVHLTVRFGELQDRITINQFSRPQMTPQYIRKQIMDRFPFLKRRYFIIRIVDAATCSTGLGGLDLDDAFSQFKNVLRDGVAGSQPAADDAPQFVPPNLAVELDKNEVTFRFKTPPIVYRALHLILLTFISLVIATLQGDFVGFAWGVGLLLYFAFWMFVGSTAESRRPVEGLLGLAVLLLVGLVCLISWNAAVSASSSGNRLSASTIGVLVFHVAYILVLGEFAFATLRTVLELRRLDRQLEMEAAEDARAMTLAASPAAEEAAEAGLLAPSAGASQQAATATLSPPAARASEAQKRRRKSFWQRLSKRLRGHRTSPGEPSFSYSTSSSSSSSSSDDERGQEHQQQRREERDRGGRTSFLPSGKRSIKKTSGRGSRTPVRTRPAPPAPRTIAAVDDLGPSSSI